jgi:asparagine synthase (glutamine-hydrolysing)
MYHSIEVRSPFLDDNVIDYALHSFKGEYVESDVTKILLREFASTYFGKDFAFRKKTGFSFDLVQYLKKDLRDDISLIPRRIEIMGFTKILNIDEIKNLINKTEWSKPDSRIIWSLLVLLEWCYQRDLSVS